MAAAAVSLSMYQEPNREFVVVNNSTPDLMKVVAEIFHRILTPLYGNQDKAIGQIALSTDRVCHLLLENNTPVGVLVYKTSPSDEFQEFGVEKSIEVKSLFVDDAGKNSGKGLGSTLVTKLIQEVSKITETHLGTHVTVSETKQESLVFFRKKGFQIVHQWKDRYIRGVTEYLLSCPEKIQAASQEMASLAIRMGNFWAGRPNYKGVGLIPHVIHVIEKAHVNDIHGLILLSDGTFVSGSKDHSLMQWDRFGQLVQTIDEPSPMGSDPRDWITAMQVINPSYWVSGERNGRVSLWKNNGKYIADLRVKFPSSRHVSHPFNEHRVNCLAAGLNPSEPSVFVGFATQFNEYNLIERREIGSTKAHKNDWVYCIEPLTEDRMLIVTGCTLDVWTKQDKKWTKTAPLIKEPPRDTGMKRERGTKRPFISALKKLQNQETQFAVASFDGTVKVIDIAIGATQAQWGEHLGQIWSIESIRENLLVSASEDKSLQFYDPREKEPVVTIKDHVGPVSATLRYNDDLLLASTCPPNALLTHQSAEIRFYDIRRNTSWPVTTL